MCKDSEPVKRLGRMSQGLHATTQDAAATAARHACGEAQGLHLTNDVFSHGLVWVERAPECVGVQLDPPPVCPGYEVSAVVVVPRCKVQHKLSGVWDHGWPAVTQQKKMQDKSTAVALNVRLAWTISKPITGACFHAHAPCVRGCNITALLVGCCSCGLNQVPVV